MGQSLVNKKEWIVDRKATYIKKWTEAETLDLYNKLKSGMSQVEAAKALDRTPMSVGNKTYTCQRDKLYGFDKLPRNKPKLNWTQEAFDKLLKLYAEGLTTGEIATRLHITTKQVQQKLSRTGNL